MSLGKVYKKFLENILVVNKDGEEIILTNYILFRDVIGVLNGSGHHEQIQYRLPNDGYVSLLEDGTFKVRDTGEILTLKTA